MISSARYLQRYSALIVVRFTLCFCQFAPSYDVITIATRVLVIITVLLFHFSVHLSLQVNLSEQQTHDLSLGYNIIHYPMVIMTWSTP